ncbi:hypothetical protein KZZ52_48910 [Dactylosporangium sp. AC04546]|uniref:hypothetical protein n=1 Tax=Dactylosporangium sp. AC04546 TaxID=2862460 RepID=UPI001EE0F793|nr:hypothetical protein [Dactylosporangium sp. AC04546]WVK81811.1 hypothetical protein KZZ52_48910 [Dactylosporangium sp. AC04546]
MQQEQRGPVVGETYVPEPRRGEHDDRDEPAVGTAHAADAEGVDADPDREQTYPAGTYVSGTSETDRDDRDDPDDPDAEVVDRDEALADEEVREAEDRDVLADHHGRDAIGDRVDEDVAAERTDSPAGDPVAEDERDEAAEDRRWEAGQPGRTDVSDLDVQPVDEGARDDHTRAFDDSGDRSWAAEHATQLRAGSVDTEPPAAGADASTDTDTYADSDTLAETEATGETTDGEPVAAATGEPGGEPEALRPGAIEPEPLGAFWADGAVDGLRERWRELQLRFIDDPRSVAGEADQLVGEAVASLTAGLEEQRRRLTDWQGDGDDTERLRAAVRGYRDFLDRLLGL